MAFTRSCSRPCPLQDFDEFRVADSQSLFRCCWWKTKWNDTTSRHRDDFIELYSVYYDKDKVAQGARTKSTHINATYSLTQDMHMERDTKEAQGLNKEHKKKNKTKQKKKVQPTTNGGRLLSTSRKNVCCSSVSGHALPGQDAQEPLKKKNS